MVRTLVHEPEAEISQRHFSTKRDFYQQIPQDDFIGLHKLNYNFVDLDVRSVFVLNDMYN